MPRTPRKALPKLVRKPPPRSGGTAARLAGALNLGPKSAAWLVDAGIRDLAAVRRLGAVRAFLKVRARQPRASLNLLWALAGALEGRHFADLPDGLRSALLMELDARTAVPSPDGKKGDGRTPPRARPGRRRSSR